MSKYEEFQSPLMLPQRNQVEVVTRSINNYFTTLGSDGVGEAEDHYEQLEALKHASQGETFIATFSSNPGGSYAGILAWKNALENTEAHTIAILEGDLASAGTIIPLFFDQIHLTPYTTFMCHSANFGVSRNTALNVEANALFHTRQVKRFIREAYKYFLSEEEVLKILDGAELYLDEFEIQERLEKRAELMAAEAEEECDSVDCPIRVEGVIHKTEVIAEVVSDAAPPAKKKAPAKKASPKKTK